MPDVAEFEIRLIDSVAGPAKRAAAAVAKLEKEAAKAKAAVSFGGELHKTEAALSKLKADPGGFKKLIEAQHELSKMREKLGKEPFHKQLGEAFGEHLGFAKLFSAAALADMFVEGAMKAVEVLADGIKDAFKAAAAEETLRLGFKLSLGKEGKESLEDITRFSKQSGFSPDEIAKMILPLRRAGLEQKAARSAFAAAADVAAGEGRGGDVGRVSELMDMFKRIRLKGGVTGKQLVGLGVDVKAFFADLGKQLGVSAKHAEEMAHKGAVGPQRLLNTVFKGIERQQKGQLGTGQVAYSKTFEARMHKLSNLPDEYMRALVDSPGWSKLSDKIGTVLESLNPESANGKKIIGSLIGAFDTITDAVDRFTKPENIAKFSEALVRVVHIAERLVGALDKAAMVTDFLTGGSGNEELEKATRVAAGQSMADVKSKESLRQQVAQEALQPIVVMDERFPVREPPRPVAMRGGNVAAGQSQAKVIHIHAPITQHFGGDSDGEDSTHTAQKKGQEAHRHTVRALERAAQEGGAS